MPIKRHRVAEWIKKQTRPVHVLLVRDLAQIERHTQAESKLMKKKFYTNRNFKKR